MASIHSAFSNYLQRPDQHNNYLRSGISSCRHLTAASVLKIGIVDEVFVALDEDKSVFIEPVVQVPQWPLFLNAIFSSLFQALRSEDRGSVVTVSEERKKGSEGEEDPGNAGDGPPPQIEN